MQSNEMNISIYPFKMVQAIRKEFEKYFFVKFFFVQTSLGIPGVLKGIKWT